MCHQAVVSGRIVPVPGVESMWTDGTPPVAESSTCGQGYSGEANIYYQSRGSPNHSRTYYRRNARTAETSPTTGVFRNTQEEQVQNVVEENEIMIMVKTKIDQVRETEREREILYSKIKSLQSRGGYWCRTKRWRLKKYLD